MTTKNNYSRRTYELAFCESDGISKDKCNLYELLNIKDNGADYEWKYAIAEIIDEVLDLKKNERMQFLYSRDNPQSFGLIVRTN